MKKNFVFLLGGIVTGIALCLTTAMLIPLDDERSSHRSDFAPWEREVEVRAWASWTVSLSGLPRRS